MANILHTPQIRSQTEHRTETKVITLVGNILFIEKGCAAGSLYVNHEMLLYHLREVAGVFSLMELLLCLQCLHHHSLTYNETRALNSIEFCSMFCIWLTFD